MKFPYRMLCVLKYALIVSEHMYQARLQIGGKSDGERMVMLAQTGAGDWRELGSSASAADGLRELQNLLSKSEMEIEPAYRNQAVLAYSVKPETYLQSPLRNLADRVMARCAVRVMRHLVNSTELAILDTIEKRLTGEIDVYGATTNEKIIPAALELYEHFSRKYMVRWHTVVELLHAWATGTCESGQNLMDMLFGVEAPRIGCAANLSALSTRGAVQRESMGAVIVACKNGRCTNIDLKPEKALEVIREFRKRFFDASGRPAGVAHGNSSKFPVIDITWAPKSRASRMVGGGDEDSDDDDGLESEPEKERDL